jgi:hypothetical protein
VVVAVARVFAVSLLAFEAVSLMLPSRFRFLPLPRRFAQYKEAGEVGVYCGERNGGDVGGVVVTPS